MNLEKLRKWLHEYELSAVEAFCNNLPSDTRHHYLMQLSSVGAIQREHEGQGLMSSGEAGLFTGSRAANAIK